VTYDLRAMSSSPDVSEGPRPATPRELQAVIHAEREGVPFLLYRDAEGTQQLMRMSTDRPSLMVGRNPAADLCVGWDGEVSGLHAQLEQAGGEFALVDDGLSRNGSYVNGERVRGRRRLLDGDMLRFGQTVVLFRRPASPAVESTVPASEALTAESLSEQQRKVLTALCRPFKDGDPLATPTSNQEIADELFVTVDAVKVHLRALFDKFGVADLPQNKKRVALVRRALQSGLISSREL
jgi:predicted component of type VI protein secretion system